MERIERLAARGWRSICAGCGFLLTQLNVVGSLLLLYVMQQPSAPMDVLMLIPENLRPLVQVLLPIVWFMLVQFAKRRAVTDGMKQGASDAQGS